jgi:polar amino acid transport system permease protein
LSYHWRWDLILPTTLEGEGRFYYLIAGFWLTLEISSLSIVFGIVLGLLIAFLGLSRFTIRLFHLDLKVYLLFQAFIRLFLELLRNLPVFVLLLWAYFALPILSPFEIGPFEAIVFTLSMTAAAFFSEIFRAGIESIDRGHIEAARSLGMSGWQTMRRIVLPQAIRRVIPPITSEFVIVCGRTRAHPACWPDDCQPESEPSAGSLCLFDDRIFDHSGHPLPLLTVAGEENGGSLTLVEAHSSETSGT